MATVPREPAPTSVVPSPPINELATQFSEPSRQFMILTNVRPYLFVQKTSFGLSQSGHT